MASLTYLTVFLLCFAVCLFAICFDRESILEFLLVLAVPLCLPAGGGVPHVLRVWFGFGFQIFLEITYLGMIYHIQKDS